MQTQNRKLHVHINYYTGRPNFDYRYCCEDLPSSEMEANQGEAGDGRWFSDMSSDGVEGRCPRLVGVIFIAKEVIVDIELKLIACIVGIVLGALLSVYVRVQLVPAVALFSFLLGLCFVKVWTLFSGTKFAPEPAMFLRLFSSFVFCLVIADESSSIFFLLYSLVYVIFIAYTFLFLRKQFDSFTP